MDEGDPCFEYHVTFPKAKHPSDEPEKPLVVLFGWAGCRDRYLAKYSAIYEDRGLVTLRYTAPVRCLFWRRSRMADVGRQLVRLIVDLGLDARPIVVHCFSNGGAFLYQNFSSALDECPRPLMIKGVIVDSAPGKRRLGSLYKAISAIVGGGFWYNFPVSVFITTVCTVMWIYEILAALLKPGCIFKSDPFEILKSEKNKWPQHFIYSKADVLIPYQDVEYFADYREMAGVRVTRLCYDDSEHVKHYTRNPESYASSVSDFIDRCLE